MRNTYASARKSKPCKVEEDDASHEKLSQKRPARQQRRKQRRMKKIEDQLQHDALPKSNAISDEPAWKFLSRFDKQISQWLKDYMQKIEDESERIRLLDFIMQLESYR